MAKSNVAATGPRVRDTAIDEEVPCAGPVVGSDRLGVWVVAVEVPAQRAALVLHCSSEG